MADGSLPPHHHTCATCGASVDDTRAADAAMLQRMAEMILEVGEVARGRVVEVPAEHPAVGLTLARLSRSLRLTLALKRRVLDEQASFAETQKAKAAAEARELARTAAFQRELLEGAKENKTEAIAIAKTMAVEDLREKGVDVEGIDQESLFAELNERLDDDSDLEALIDYTLVDLVTLLCTKLGVPFDPASVRHNDDTLRHDWLDDLPEPPPEPPKHKSWA